MNFKETLLAGVWVIEFEANRDERGAFRRHFCETEFRKKGIDATVRQCSLSENIKRGTLRGFHFQRHPHWEPKTISCLKGSVHALALDLRPESKTFKKWFPLILDSRKPISVHIPVGCAMAWITLEDDTVLHYFMGENFIPSTGGGVRYNDPQFGFEWPMEPLVISQKDRTWPDFDPKFLR